MPSCVKKLCNDLMLLNITDMYVVSIMFIMCSFIAPPSLAQRDARALPRHTCALPAPVTPKMMTCRRATACRNKQTQYYYRQHVHASL